MAAESAVPRGEHWDDVRVVLKGDMTGAESVDEMVEQSGVWKGTQMGLGSAVPTVGEMADSSDYLKDDGWDAKTAAEAVVVTAALLVDA